MIGEIFLSIVICFVVSVLVRRRYRKIFQFHNRVAVITGGASGIGLSTSIALLKQGCHVVVWDKNAYLFSEVREELEDASELHGCTQFTFIQVDISNESQVMDAMKFTERWIQRNQLRDVSILVNNAGIVYDSNIEQCESHVFEDTMMVNAVGPMHITQLFMNKFIQDSAESKCVFFVSSLIGYLPASHLSAYSASKAALTSFAACLRVEMKSKMHNHVNICCLCPQYVNTGMFEGVRSDQSIGSRMRNWLFPPNSPCQIAETILYQIQHGIEHLILPRVMHLVIPFLFSLPIWLFDWTVMQIGGKDGMDGFRGRGSEWNETSRR